MSSDDEFINNGFGSSAEEDDDISVDEGDTPEISIEDEDEGSGIDLGSESEEEYESRAQMIPLKYTGCTNDIYNGVIYNIDSEDQLRADVSYFESPEPASADGSQFGQPGQFTKDGVEYELVYSIHSNSWICYPIGTDIPLDILCPGQQW